MLGDAADVANSTLNNSIALLRGINVGGKNRLPMKDLTALFMDAGCSDVRTYIQSGNVLFEAAQALSKDIPSLVSASILNRFGYQVPVLTRTVKEFRDIVQANPFVKAGAEADKLHVVFLADLPDGEQVETLDQNRSPGDEFTVVGREIYLHCPSGFASTKLTNSYFDSRLSTVSSTRNWKTVQKIFELATASVG